MVQSYFDCTFLIPCEHPSLRSGARLRVEWCACPLRSCRGRRAPLPPLSCALAVAYGSLLPALRRAAWLALRGWARGFYAPAVAAPFWSQPPQVAPAA